MVINAPSEYIGKEGLSLRYKILSGLATKPTTTTKSKNT